MTQTITFVDEEDNTLVSHVYTETVPRIGEMVNIPIEGKKYSRQAYRVKDVEYPVIYGANGNYLQVFVTLVKLDK